jgi:hypothetical protein
VSIGDPMMDSEVVYVILTYAFQVLAVQNMEAHGSVPKGQDIEFAALEGSLSMMSKGMYCDISDRITG